MAKQVAENDGNKAAVNSQTNRGSSFIQSVIGRGNAGDMFLKLRSDKGKSIEIPEFNALEQL